MVSQIIFAVAVIASFVVFGRKVGQLRRNIFLGRPENITGDTAIRLKNMALIAFGQQKMFKRWIPALLHLFIYVAFLVTQVELIEIFIDGFTGEHRLIWHAVEGTFLGTIYTAIISFIEILSVLALIATFLFLARRNLLKIPRFHKSEMNGWPKLDGNIILYIEILLVTFIFMMNSGDLALQAKGVYHHTDSFAISQFIAPLWSGMEIESIKLIERIGWWGHIVVVLGFLNYIPYSKHLHIFLAFPNTYYSKLNPKGELENIEAVTKEVAPMFEEEPELVPAQELKIDLPNPSNTKEVEGESMDDIFGDTGSSEESTESMDDIFGDTGSSEESTESMDDIFGDTGSSEEVTESMDDIFGDTGSSEEVTESMDDIFGDTGSSEESVDDIFGNAGDNQESVDDIFGNNEEESIDDLFGDQPAVSNEKTVEVPQELIQQVVEEEEMVKFGASDVFDLSWKNILDAYTCTECGRCTSVCPANLTGKKLSPRKVMMDVRDRATEIGNNIDQNKTDLIRSDYQGKVLKLSKDNYEDGKTLFDYISIEELRGCTTCNACVEACPVTINPLDIIVQLRQNLILDQADAPEAWNVMFTNIENNGAPWQFSQADRANWTELMD